MKTSCVTLGFLGEDPISRSFPGSDNKRAKGGERRDTFECLEATALNFLGSEHCSGYQEASVHQGTGEYSFSSNQMHFYKQMASYSSILEHSSPP